VLPFEGFCRGLLVGLVIGLHLANVRPFNGFPTGSHAVFFVELPVGLGVSFLTLADVIRGGLLSGLLVGLRASFLTSVAGFPLLTLDDDIPGSSLSGLLVAFVVKSQVSSFHTSTDYSLDCALLFSSPRFSPRRLRLWIGYLLVREFFYFCRLSWRF
jgi:hypothetical protein